MAEEGETPKNKVRVFSKRNQKKARKLTPAEKTTLLENYRNGTATASELAKKYGRKPQSIYNLARAHGIKKGENSEVVRQAIQEEVQKSLAEDAHVIAARIKETKEEHYRMSAGLTKLVWKTIAEAKRDGKRIDNASANEIRAYKIAAETLRITRTERYAVLSVADKEKEELENRQDFPELTIQELDAQTIQKMNAAQRLEMDDIGEMWDGDDPNIAFSDKVEEGEGGEDEEVD